MEGPRGRELRALLLTCRDLVALVLVGGANTGDQYGVRCPEPGLGEGGSQHSARAPFFLTEDRDPSCLQVTKAGSGMSCGTGLSFLWNLDSRERKG